MLLLLFIYYLWYASTSRNQKIKNGKSPAHVSEIVIILEIPRNRWLWSGPVGMCRLKIEDSDAQ